jgi:hypothetical protein
MSRIPTRAEVMEMVKDKPIIRIGSGYYKEFCMNRYICMGCCGCYDLGDNGHKCTGVSNIDESPRPTDQ